MSGGMSLKQFGELLKHIDAEHSPIRIPDQGRVAKYVDPHIDMRTKTVFAVTIRGYGGQRSFHTQNDCRDLPQTLFERVMAYLDGEDVF